MSVKVKICGVTKIEDAIAAVDAGADLIGLNFYPPSPRSVDFARAAAIARALAGRARLVGVYVGVPREAIARACQELRLDFVQIHGPLESEEDALADLPVPVIRALAIKAGTTPAELTDLIRQSKAAYVLLDSHHPELHGGTGTPLGMDLDALRQVDLSRVFVAGGLTPETVAAAARLQPYAVDVASGVESAPGIKDHRKLRSFIRNAKSSR